jgi:hypothetical protein
MKMSMLATNRRYSAILTGERQRGRDAQPKRRARIREHAPDVRAGLFERIFMHVRSNLNTISLVFIICKAVRCLDI